MSAIACVLAMASAAFAQLTLDGVRCGQLTCDLEEYCSPETNRCAPCNIVCNKTHHNYDSGLCVKECQGYLLDLRFMRRTETISTPNNFSSVQTQARAALIVSGVALAVLLVILVILCRGKVTWRYIKNKFQPSKNRVKQYPPEWSLHNHHAETLPNQVQEHKVEVRVPEPPKRQQPLNVKDLDLRSSVTEKSQGATTPKTISTTVSNRYPAEDTTLDYSYDNRAMNVTPPEPASDSRF